MSPFDYLFSALSNIANDFPQVHIKYFYHKIINTHIVELLPIDEYRNNEKLDNAWIPLSFKFKEKFPDEEIAFVSSDSTLIGDIPEFELNTPNVDIEIITELFASFSSNELNYTFPTYFTVSASAMSIGYPIVAVLSYAEQILVQDFSDETIYQAAA